MQNKTVLPLPVIDQLKRELCRQRKILSNYRSGLGGIERQLNRLSRYRRTRQWRTHKGYRYGEDNKDQTRA